MNVFNLDEENSLLKRFVAELRDVDVQSDSMRFRRNLERIGEVLAYEISKHLDFEPTDTKTPLGVASSHQVKENIVVSTILRAGLPMHQGFLNYFDGAENAFVSAYRKYTDKEHFDIHVEYISSPILEGKTLILVDPMLATGSSFELAYEALLSKGRPVRTIMACAIASQEGIDKLSSAPALIDVDIWCAAIDPELNAKSYIVPGLGDAGDLAYGIKD